MFNFIKEVVMAPTTRSSSQQQSKKVAIEKCEEKTITKNVTNLPAPLIKGYKITDNERSRKYGIGASSLETLKSKAKLKFPVSGNGIYILLLFLFFAKNNLEL